jgi:hypothetical protein
MLIRIDKLGIDSQFYIVTEKELMENTAGGQAIKNAEFLSPTMQVIDYERLKRIVH